MSKPPHIICDHIELDGERYVLLDANPEQVLRFVHKHYRTEAFAAIRRAAAYARDLDDGREPRDSEEAAGAFWVRDAIRTAIGSPKTYAAWCAELYTKKPE